MEEDDLLALNTWRANKEREVVRGDAQAKTNKNIRQKKVGNKKKTEEKRQPATKERNKQKDTGNKRENKNRRKWCGCHLGLRSREEDVRWDWKRSGANWTLEPQADRASRVERFIFTHI